MKGCVGLLLCTTLFFSCNRSEVVISGDFASCGQKMVYLEVIRPERVSVVDSVRANREGSFKFKIKSVGGESMLYNLRVNGETMTLLLAPGERVNVYSICNNARNYSVKGSSGSLLVKELRTILQDGIEKMDSLRNIMFKEETSDARRDSLTDEYGAVYMDTKRAQLNFLVTNSGSPVAIYGLYQRLPNDNILFNGESDIVYYRMVADSVGVHHPGSPYLVSLKTALARYDNMQEDLLTNDPE